MGFIFGAISGLVTAALQWLALKPWLPSPRSWLVLNAIGWGMVHAINDGVPIQFDLQLVVTGIIVALTQYLALRHLLSHAILWVPLAAIAWVVGFQLGNSLYAGEDPGNLIVTGLTVGIITGLTLRFLLRPVLRPTPNNLAANKPPLTRVVRVILLVVAVVILLPMALLLAGLNPFGW